MTNFLTCSTWAYFWFALSSSAWTRSRTFGSWLSSAMSCDRPFSSANLATSSSSSVTSITGNGRRSPCMTACDTQRDCLRSFSKFAGVRFLPPAVMMMSFLRPVIDR